MADAGCTTGGAAGSALDLLHRMQRAAAIEFVSPHVHTQPLFCGAGFSAFGLSLGEPQNTHLALDHSFSCLQLQHSRTARGANNDFLQKKQTFDPSVFSVEQLGHFIVFFGFAGSGLARPS